MFLSKNFYYNLKYYLINLYIISIVFKFVREKLEHFPSICILDMSGFENFQVNSFEQFCINVANEHLQFYFNEHIFLQEEEEYSTEGIDFASVDFQNNEDLIELFMGVNINYVLKY